MRKEKGHCSPTGPISIMARLSTTAAQSPRELTVLLRVYSTIYVGHVAIEGRLRPLRKEAATLRQFDAGPWSSGGYVVSLKKMFERSYTSTEGRPYNCGLGRKWGSRHLTFNHSSRQGGIQLRSLMMKNAPEQRCPCTGPVQIVE